MTAPTPEQAASDLQTEQEDAEFYKWVDSLGYMPNPAALSTKWDAFRAGMQAARNLAAQEPQPAPVMHQLSGLVAGWRDAFRTIEEGPYSDAACARADTLREVTRQILEVIANATAPEPKPAPGLAAEMRNGKKLAIALDALREIRDEPYPGFGPDRAAQALDRIAAIDPPLAEILPGDDEELDDEELGIVNWADTGADE